MLIEELLPHVDDAYPTIPGEHSMNLALAFALTELKKRDRSMVDR